MDLERTIQDLAPRLLRYCLGRTGDRDLAEEVAQETLAALARRWRRYGPPESPEGFAFTVARRRAFRANARRRLFEPLHLMAPGFFHPGPDPEQQALQRSDLDHTLAAIRRLPSRDREALLLVVAGGVGTAEGARLLGISVSALKMRVSRARQRLLALLENGHAAP
ncbi:MAG TPA: RNA polymerase sigma factor [Thermoanaerobaculia bacterium]|nr:RNA polymerase sigma factor [Thermoanaerobaculia bacterium]